MTNHSGSSQSNSKEQCQLQYVPFSKIAWIMKYFCEILPFERKCQFWSSSLLGTRNTSSSSPSFCHRVDVDKKWVENIAASRHPLRSPCCSFSLDCVVSFSCLQPHRFVGDPKSTTISTSIVVVLIWFVWHTTSFWGTHPDSSTHTIMRLSVAVWSHPHPPPVQRLQRFVVVVLVLVLVVWPETASSGVEFGRAG